MEFKDIFLRVRNRIRKAQQEVENKRLEFQDAFRNILDSIQEEWIEKSLQKAKEALAPSLEEIPIDLELKKSNLFRKTYEYLFPISHAFRLSYRYNREFLDEYMPISQTTFLGRGNYKFVYALPWRMVVKISKFILPSNPIYGSLFKEVQSRPEYFLTREELNLYEYISRNKKKWFRENLWFSFLRLGLERYHYGILKNALPELVIPTRHFMGIQYRHIPFLENILLESIVPMDVQVILTGKHLKEFAKATRKVDNKSFLNFFSPSYTIEFDIGTYRNIKKKVLIKIKENLFKLIRFSERLAKEKKLILDIHTENIIITIPEFELKLFDFHIFDEHLYDYGDNTLDPLKDHIEIIKMFIESLGVDDE